MNLANCITLSRIPLLFVVTFFVYFRFIGSASIGFVIFVLTSLTDWLDGHLARKYDITSTLGTFIDALIDKIFIVGLLVAMLALNILPRWSLFFVLSIVGREFLVTGIRLVAAKQNIVLAASREGKLKTVLQIVAAGFFLLWHAIVLDFGWLIPAWMVSFVRTVGMVLFLYATYLTIKSGLAYTVRYKHLLVD
ncbi:MAG: CDP-diacylglycerol--glycerol-3-phosphate 3-phosphatidyltransferase [Puniceicoccales bacterium]|jgi:CDP-diacylglycerol--glycerol-3-phosphate 3-phosphatidyltransferase|nr:CDP-diacylglycerol--glycerol-3-phosphate 3-phosphatidyltransferase [Puniceicoccales bacterium]